MENIREYAVSFVVVSLVGIGEVIVDTRRFCDNPWDDSDARLHYSCLCVAEIGLRHAAGKMHQAFCCVHTVLDHRPRKREISFRRLRCTCSSWHAPSCDIRVLLGVRAAVTSFACPRISSSVSAGEIVGFIDEFVYIKSVY